MTDNVSNEHDVLRSGERDISVEMQLQSLGDRMKGIERRLDMQPA